MFSHQRLSFIWYVIMLRDKLLVVSSWRSSDSMDHARMDPWMPFRTPRTFRTKWSRAGKGEEGDDSIGWTFLDGVRFVCCRMMEALCFDVGGVYLELLWVCCWGSFLGDTIVGSICWALIDRWLIGTMRVSARAVA